MSTMQVTLPDALQDFVNAQVTARGYSSSSEFICELIRKELDRQRLRELILDGAASTRGVVVDVEYFQGLRSRIVSDASRQ
ncbi:MAG: ribbon-helix-helix domain-containing protein [Gammaproteobacteria bacterium]|nr:ribbon-helix-helix domain-containing protein [Gammaproteobacteria bacterium]